MNALKSKTILGLLVTAGATFGLPAVAPEATTWEVALQVFGLLLALIGRWTAKGPLSAPPKAVPLFVGLSLALGACAAPAAEQGRSGQGGSTGSAPVVVINIGSDHGSVTVSSLPTAAPAASSQATASQTAENETKPALNLGDSAIKAGVDALKPIPPLPAPTPAPVTPEVPR